MRILNTIEYLNIERPSLEWIVQDKIPYPGLILIEGPPKAGKSFLSFDLARCIGRGEPFLGHQTHKSKVLYLQFDTSEAIWRKRLLTIQASGVDLSGDLYNIHPDDMLRPFNILNLTHQAWLRKVNSECQAKVVFIDVFREIHNADENDSTQMKIVGDLLFNIFKHQTLILIHHSKKINEDTYIDPATLSRGSSYITGKVDALWLLHKGLLTIQDRISETSTVRLKQLPSGLWTFRHKPNIASSNPDIDNIDKAHYE